MLVIRGSVIALVIGCGSVKNEPLDAAGPTITSFTAEPMDIAVGGTTMLTAVFEGGEGSINNGGGLVASGVPVAVSPSVTTTFVLSVSSDGQLVTRDVTVNVIDFAVTSLGDAGPNTLRDAILMASGSTQAKTIGILTGGTITLESPLPPVTGAITIFGTQPVTINGADRFRIFTVDGNVTLRELTLSNGRATGGAGGVDNLSGGGGGGGAGMGGAVFVNSGTVLIDRVVFTANRAIGGAGGAAGSFNLGSGGGGGGSFAGDATGRSGAGNGFLGAAGGGNGGINGGGAGTDGQFASGGGGGGNANGAPGGLGGNGGFGGGGGGGGGGNNAGLGGMSGLFGGVGGRNGSAGGGGGGGGLGGALFVRSGTVTIDTCTFSNNSASGGAGGVPFGIIMAAGATGLGKAGAIFVNGTATVTNANPTFTGNTATDAGTIGTDNGDVFGTIN